MILIPCPIRPDLDCIACAVGYAEYLRAAKKQNVKAWLCDPPDGEARFYIDQFKDIDFATEDDVEKAESFILVDISDKRFISDKIAPEKVIEVIDHHLFTTPHDDFPNARIQMDTVGAAATQITEYFMRDDRAPSETAASMLYGAIYSNTMCFQSDLYTDRDKAAASWLKEKQPLSDRFIAAQLAARKKEILDDFPEILSTEMNIGRNVSGTYGISQLEMVDALAFWQDSKTAIHEHFKRYDHPVFLNIVDLSTHSSIFYSTLSFDKDWGDAVRITQREDNAIHFTPALMRKQIIPFLNTM